MPATKLLNTPAVRLPSQASLLKPSPIQSLSPQDRPREKLLARGEASLSDLELLQVIIGSGIKGADVIKLSKDIHALLILHNGKVTLEQLTGIRGISTATASKLVASLELTGRFVKTGTKVETEDDVLPLLADIRFKKQEHFVVITLDGANRLIDKRVITIGTLNASLVHPREVFADAVADRAAGIVIAHNHPGGSLEPSGPDIVTTKRLRAAGELLGIRLLDHIIVTATGHCIVEV
jgi:DNA repair protein RadC